MTPSIHKFEGPEKKLEVILTAPRADLRDNRDGRWQQVAAASRARILSRVSSTQMDAYLLSESSLFVWADRVLMITCGRTTLARAVPPILEVVGRRQVALIFYERKNLLYPREQPSGFADDVAEIERHFSGKRYRLGPADRDHVHVFYAAGGAPTQDPDATVQVLMHDIDPGLRKVFSASGAGHPARRQVADRLTALCPGMRCDQHYFAPYGYSLNAVSVGRYCTVHVTPQPESSYASFESNRVAADYRSTLRQVCDLFRPGRFSLVLTSRMVGDWQGPHRRLESGVDGYAVTEKNHYEFDCGYAVSFLNFLHGPGAC